MMYQKFIPATLLILTFFLSACTGGGTEGTNGLAISDKKISGVSQKGPFVKGSKVTVLELGENLVQTGRAFRSSISNAGEFSIPSISLESKYAILEVTGFYWNEITGKQSNSQITLNAIADLSDRENVNINLLTQLEYERVNYLIENKKMSVRDAKAQAKKEIIKAFHGSENVDDLEDLNIFGTTEGDAMLLAISALVQGDNNEAKLTELLADLATDLQDDGIIDDSTYLVGIADYASTRLAVSSVRNNVLSWNISDTVPNFEKFINNFWATEYKLGSCSNENEGEIKKNGNKYSVYANTNYTCKNGEWKIAFFNPDIEYGTLKDSRDGKIYRTVKIGEQVWMAENLNFASDEENGNSYCYDDIESYCDTYGRLYTYPAAAVACPKDWHLPTNEEWLELIDYIGGLEGAAKALRAKGAWSLRDYPETAEDEDKFGFSALPAGVYYFGAFGKSAWFSSSTLLSEHSDAIRNIGVENADAAINGNAMFSTAISVRCIKD